MKRTLVFVVIATLVIGSPWSSSTGAQDKMDQLPIELTNNLSVIDYYFVQDGESVMVYGLLLNEADSPQLVPTISFSFVSESDVEYLSGIATPSYERVEAGEEMGFSGAVIRGVLRVGDWHREEITPNDFPAGSIEDYDASMLEFDGFPREGDADGGNVIGGTIVNTGNVPIQISGTSMELYGSSGKFLGSCFAPLSITIPPAKFIRVSYEFNDAGICPAQTPSVRAIGLLPFTYKLLIHRLK